MADSQAGEGRSLNLRLSAAICLAILAVAAVAGWVSYDRARAGADGLQDDVLRQVAALATAGHVTAGDLGAGSGLVDAESEVRVTSAAAVGVPANAPDGFTTVTVAGVTRRALVSTQSDGSRIVVSQSAQVRDEIAHETALAAVGPLITLLPFLLLTVPLITQATLRPVHDLADDLGTRPPDDLRPLPLADVPRELRGLVVALNSQRARTAELIEAERRFIGEASHELRTPLAAISLQLERARAATDPQEAQARLTVLASGVERARHLVAQLLDLARAQSTTPVGPPDTPFAEVFLGVLADASSLAESRQIDLTVEGGTDLEVPVARTPVTLILRNLIDNAVRYTDPGGQVLLSATLGAGRLTCIVEDNGPGILDPEHALEPFHRELRPDAAEADPTGSGLGLTIVAGEVRRLSGSLTIDAADKHATGTRVTVRWPVGG